jgi:hypothetical protein
LSNRIPLKPVIQSDEMVEEIPQLPEPLKKSPNGNYILPEVTESIYITAVSEQVSCYNIDGMITGNDRPGIASRHRVNGAQFYRLPKF